MIVSPYGPLNDFYFSTLGLLCGPLDSNAYFAFTSASDVRAWLKDLLKWNREEER